MKKVSIIVTTYNHEKYIRKCIDSLLMQKTNFEFEVILGDDSSTDATQDILQEYLVKHPKIFDFFPNPKNTGMMQNFLRCLKKAKGEFVAICEGDDYWIDPYKIQKQITAMLQHPKSDISFHPARMDNLKTGTSEIIAQHAAQNKIFTPEEVILGGGEFMPTASLVFKREICDSIPDWFYKAPVGDYFMQILGSLKGGALYLPDVMSVYQLHTPGSWTVSMQSHDRQIKLNSQLILSLTDLDNHTHQEYHDVIHKKQLFILLNTIRNRNISLAQRKIFYTQRNKVKIPLKNKISWLIIYRIPILHRILAKLKSIRF